MKKRFLLICRSYFLLSQILKPSPVAFLKEETSQFDPYRHSFPFYGESVKCSPPKTLGDELGRMKEQRFVERTR